MGVRVVTGSAIGLGVYSVTQVIANLTLLLNLNPVLTALAPAGICTLLALYILKRVT
jgi:lipopolysaccharide export LptBFGC system permease protein LptF